MGELHLDRDRFAKLCDHFLPVGLVSGELQDQDFLAASNNQAFSWVLRWRCLPRS